MKIVFLEGGERNRTWTTPFLCCIVGVEVDTMYRWVTCRVPLRWSLFLSG